MKRKRNRKYFILFAFFIVGFVALDRLGIFEKKAPVVYVEDILYVNSQSLIPLRITDEESGLKSVQISLKKDNAKEYTSLISEKLKNQKDVILQIPVPKASFREKVSFYTMQITAKDSSLWNFFSGNLTTKEVKVIVDDVQPFVTILSNSYQIEQGGVASVVFKVNDENLDTVFIETNTNKKFQVVPYIKEDYYAALIAWDPTQKDFRAHVVAKDKAGNITRERIKYYLVNRKYKESNIILSDKFLDNKINSLAQQYAPNSNELDNLGKFKFVNETLRLENESVIHEITSKIHEEKLDEFKINLFLPMKNAMKVADFADHRFYSYEGKFVSDSYHLGLDLASIARDKIISNNKGKVIFAGENGIYGLNIVIYHGFGLYTLYGHNSSINVNRGDDVVAGDFIANTGVSGLALGDHLHFGVLVQGIEVRPEQWQDSGWIRNNIYKVLEEGKKIILSENKQ